jgi:hypothetical protein
MLIAKKLVSLPLRLRLLPPRVRMHKRRLKVLLLPKLGNTLEVSKPPRLLAEWLPSTLWI